ncbi:N-acetylneuraminate synthase [Leptospira gomenensis]|uniref:N-acetylneuraminate synthase n=2 Tax=Leptospira gomenensis TaxID=2484974 RepID=A0A5F1Z0Q3_9LEPT|nr:N-acetylneuraminate synthase [Leptospira gomenensis]TGK30932.1 N-acetylneuraminate synthase [Leptospira gomenensis]TGK38199.1 N-acetylneuraminate synthase [Leptospira gomenensis]TGK45348.1 N-acetylneuraminate synthase [Leptospira gomenensis]TGK66261.1 N-acetylneuraminate synthase [Leptospira gomenensis]
MLEIPNSQNLKPKPSYIIAEAGVNHNGDLELAKKLIYSAKEAGADCVKFQTFVAEEVASARAPKADYQLKVTDAQESQLDMLRKLELPRKSYPELMQLCKSIGIDFLSTPYSIGDANFLNSLGVEAFKIASGQLVEPYFLEVVAKFGKPIILSTGMATLAEIADGVKTVRNVGNQKIVVLQCTTNYPSRIEDANLRTIPMLKEALGVVVGYSDHVESNNACFAAVALGAQVIEKHFTLDRKLPGPDHSCSLEQSGFSELVRGIREVEAALGSSIKEPTEAEERNKIGMRRSVAANRDIVMGETFTYDMLCFKRPNTGLAPSKLADIIGKRATQNITNDTLLELSMVDWT